MSVSTTRLQCEEPEEGRIPDATAVVSTTTAHDVDLTSLQYTAATANATVTVENTDDDEENETIQTCHCVWGEVLPEGRRGIVLYESILGRGIARQNRNMIILFLKI